MIHKLKIKQEYANAIIGNAKHFEVRKNDRNYQIGDVVLFKVVDSTEYHGIEGRAYFIPYVLTHDEFPEAIKEGYCVFTIAELDTALAYYYTKELR